MYVPGPTQEHRLIFTVEPVVIHGDILVTIKGLRSSADMDGILQLGTSQHKQRLIHSSSFVERRRPTAGVELGQAASDNGCAPYVTQLALLANVPGLLSFSDDGYFRLHDKSSLQSVRAFKWQEGGVCSSVKAVGAGFVAAGRNGVIGCWDGRQERSSMSLAGPSNAPYLSLASSGSMIAAGTELHGADAMIEVWDVRQPNAPVLTYAEAHSDDITSLDFHPTVSSVLLSAASDSLVAVSDTRQADEDDSVLGVINTGASVARAGWGGSRRTYAKQQLSDGDVQGSSAPAALASMPSLGAFYSLSDMQTLGIWEADGFSELLPVRDVRQTQSIQGLGGWQTEYVIDATSDSTLLENGEGVGLFCGDQAGSMALIEIPHVDGNAGTAPSDWAQHCLAVGGHTEVVRSVAWDASTYVLYSGGEDGRICAWSLSGTQPSETFSSTQHGDGFTSSLGLASSASTSSFDPNPVGVAGPSRKPLKGTSNTSSSGRPPKDTQRSSSYKPY